MGNAVIVGDQDSKKSGSNANGAVVSLEWSLVVAAVGTLAPIVLVRAAGANGAVVT
ncbi:hypothetical protein [Glutamicibacter ardleyensis]|uniref:hypothetical protein n=1 Tax=Glutamicibacter ardleyensis TaxID=225894 RepID=UPI0016687A3F|nr:hypothetical protein [Glutamicibacter ardleyensis]